MIHLQDADDISFSDIEKTLFQEALSEAAAAFRRVLELLDQQIFEERDTERYIVKGIREKHLDTILGDVSYRRRYYYDTDCEKYVSLLDSLLGLKKGQRVSPSLSHVAATQAVRGPSYREARDSLEDLYNHRMISHETVRKVLMQTGEKIQAQQKRQQQEAEGKRKVSVLYLEVDGYSAHMQNDSQSRREVQMMLSHEGWARRYRGSEEDEYELVKRNHYQRIAGDSDFWEEASRDLYSRYDLKDTVVVINGDRARWIRKGVDYFDNAIYQMDRWHLIDDLENLLRDTDWMDEALSAFYSDDIPGLLAAIAAGEAQLPDGSTKGKLMDLKLDILNNQESARDYRVRLEQQGIDTTGMRGLGAAESQVDRFENRTKKRGQSWSKQGLLAMITSLAKHFAGSLEKYTKQIRIGPGLDAEKQKQRVNRIARKAIKKTSGIRQVRPPIMDAGTNRSGGLSQLFYNLSRAHHSMT